MFATMFLPAIEDAVAYIIQSGKHLCDEEESLLDRVDVRIKYAMEVPRLQLPQHLDDWASFNQWRFGVRAGLKNVLYRQEQMLMSSVVGHESE